MTTTITPRDRRESNASSLPFLAPLFWLFSNDTRGFFAIIALLVLVAAGAVALFGVPGLVLVALVMVPVILTLLVLIARP